MKVVIKTLSNKKHTLEIDANEKVEALKKLIETQLELGAVEQQKLIYGGKILKNEQTLSEAKVEENGFIVAMISKKKPAPPAPAPAAASSSAAAAPPAQSESSPTDVSSAGPDASSGPQQTGGLGSAAASSLMRGPELEGVISNLMNLGYERGHVMRALQASFNNPDRAAEFLLSGRHLQPEPAAAPSASPSQQESEASPSGAPIDPSALNSRQRAAMLSQLLQQRPEMMEALLGQLAQQNPEIMAQLGQNREAITQLLQNPQVLEQIMGGMGGPGAEDGGPPPNVIQVTEEEQQAIQRLEALGFPRHRVVEAYFACDKNEELAANYLFDHGFDDADA